MSTARAVLLLSRRAPEPLMREALDLVRFLRDARQRLDRAAADIHRTCTHDRCPTVPDGQGPTRPA